MSTDELLTRVGFPPSRPAWRIPLADIRSVGKLVRPQMSSDDSLTRVGPRARVHPFLPGEFVGCGFARYQIGTVGTSSALE